MLRHRLALALLVCAPSLWAAKKPVTIDALLEPPKNEINEGPVTWSPDGSRFVIENSGTLALYDVAAGVLRDIIPLSKLDDAAQPVAPPAVFDWTNRRVSEHDLQWFADGRRLLVSASGDLFILNVNNGHFDQLTKTAEVERDPKLSPDNRFISFRRGSELYTLEVATKTTRQLTRDGSGTLLNAELDWVYPEELDLSTAHWWSPDSRYIAYMQFNIAREPVFPQVSLLSHHALLEPQRFPQPGDPNAEVRIGVIPATGGETRWMDLGDVREALFARVAWLPSARELAVEKLARLQNSLELLAIDVETGASRVLLHEQDPYWINVKGDLHFLSDGRLLWTSERSGFRHLYLYAADGRLEKQLTSGEWEIEDVSGIDERNRRVFFTSTEASPLERQLYSISFDGGDKQRLTSGEGTHAISLAPNASAFLDDYSGFHAAPRRTLYHADGKPLRVFREPDLNETSEYEILPTEIVELNAPDGTPLYARLIKPADFQPGHKYPAVVMIYGGPGVQEVQNAWQGLSWDQVLAQKGYVVWQLDNRGSSGRGHKFESVLYRDLGSHELADQEIGIQYLIATGFVDPQRIGMYGWSYGGFMTLYTATNAPGLLKAAIAGAPVADWRDYDSIYTERYLGLPSANKAAYDKSSPVLAAANLKAALLIVHNIEDDNVHFENSMQMANALELAGKPFFMVVYPQKSHGVSGRPHRQLLEQTTDFFERYLK